MIKKWIMKPLKKNWAYLSKDDKVQKLYCNCHCSLKEHGDMYGVCNCMNCEHEECEVCQ